MRTTFGPEGDIRGTDLLAALVALWREGASGSLQFSRSGAMAGFELAGGEVVSASSSDSRFETAAILVRAGKIEAATLERLAPQEGGDRARLALQAGILTKREWRWGEKIRAVEVLSDLLTWIEGDYTFFRSSLREPGEFRLTIPRLILELFLRSRDRSLILHYLGGADAPLVRSASFDSEFSTFGLTSDAEAVVGLIDGKSTAAEIASEAPADAFAVEKLLAALVTLGLIHPEYAAEADAPTSRPTLPATPPEPIERIEPEPPVPPVEEPAETLELQAEAQPEPHLDVEEEPPAPVETPPEVSEPPPLPEPAAEEFERVGARELDLGPAVDRVDESEESEEPPEVETEVLEPEVDLSESDGRRDYESEIAGGARGPDAQESVSEGPSELYESTPFDRPLDTMTGVGASERPRPRSVSPVLWFLVLLGALVGAVLLFRARSTAKTEIAAGPTPAPRVTAVLSPGPDGVAIVTAVPVAAPTPMPTNASVATKAAVPAAAPTAIPRHAPTAAPALPKPTAARATAPAAGETASASRQTWIDHAARDAKRLASEPRTRFAIQLELACETPSLVDAWTHDRPSGSMWLLTTDFKGRQCFRVLWGRYPSKEAAKRAQARVPAFFSTPRNRPAVVAVR